MGALSAKVRSVACNSRGVSTSARDSRRLGEVVGRGGHERQTVLAAEGVLGSGRLRARGCGGAQGLERALELVARPALLRQLGAQPRQLFVAGDELRRAVERGARFVSAVLGQRRGGAVEPGTRLRGARPRVEVGVNAR